MKQNGLTTISLFALKVGLWQICNLLGSISFKEHECIGRGIICNLTFNLKWARKEYFLIFPLSSIIFSNFPSFLGLRVGGSLVQIGSSYTTAHWTLSCAHVIYNMHSLIFYHIVDQKAWVWTLSHFENGHNIISHLCLHQSLLWSTACFPVNWQWHVQAFQSYPT